MYTLDQCKQTATLVGMKESDGEDFYVQYASQDWKWGNGQPITQLPVALMRWKRNGLKMKKEDKKQKLFPIKGRICCKTGCQLPAVYGPVGDYDNYYCENHMPQSVREKYA